MEKKNHEELKETWEKANEHFVSTHNEYITVINQYREILTTDQLDALRSKSSSLDGSVGVVSIVVGSTDQVDYFFVSQYIWLIKYDIL